MDLSTLAILACPVGMGLMMWMMMRGNSRPAAEHGDGTPATAGSPPLVEPTEIRRPSGLQILRIAGMCFDWRVLAALAAVGLAVWVLAPGIIAGVLPLLLLAACPLSMLLMMRGMGKKQAPESVAPTPTTPDLRLAHLRSEIHAARDHEAALKREIDELERDAAATKSGSANGHAEVR